MHKRIKNILITLWLFLCISLGANDTEDAARINSIKEVLASGNRYKLYKADLFDGDSIWQSYRGSSYLNSIRFVPKYPKTENFDLESQLYYNDNLDKKNKSIQIYSNIEIPGRDKVFLKPVIPNFLPPGKPVRIFFWVHSNNYNINLKVILARKKSPDIIVDFGLLKFNGWRRMDEKINEYKPQDRLNLSKLNQYELKGILLESSSFQSKGTFNLLIDQMGILLEKPETYPGSEVPDGWELY